MHFSVCTLFINKKFARVLKVKVKVKSLSCARLFATPWIVACTKLLSPWDFPGKSAGVDCHFLLQGIFLTQESNPGLPHCRQMLYSLSHQGSPPTNHTFIQLSLVTLPLNSCLEASTLNPFHIPDPVEHFLLLLLNHQVGICDKKQESGGRTRDSRNLLFDCLE